MLLSVSVVSISLKYKQTSDPPLQGDSTNSLSQESGLKQNRIRKGLDRNNKLISDSLERFGSDFSTVLSFKKNYTFINAFHTALSVYENLQKKSQSFCDSFFFF